jgi:hypothetical protein
MIPSWFAASEKFRVCGCKQIQRLWIGNMFDQDGQQYLSGWLYQYQFQIQLQT